MPVPDFQSIMLPLLEATSNGKLWQLTAIREELARLFHLSPNERRELLPSGTQRVFDNRVAWAKTYLVKAKLLDYIREMDPYKFEILVIDLLQAMGYGGNREEAAQVTKKSNDGGIDGIINEDRLGLDKIYVQFSLPPPIFPKQPSITVKELTGLSS